MLNPAFVSLTCFGCCAEYRPDRRISVCERCGTTLRADYEPRALSPGTTPSLWRYDELLPVSASVAYSMGEGWTPLLEISEGVWIKDEAANPTGSFKDRGMSVAVSASATLGINGLAAPSAGNAAESLALYGSAAGLDVLVVMPEDTPEAFADSCRSMGAKVKLVPGTIADAGEWLAAHLPEGFVNVATLREPFRLEGKKTLAYELFEQLDRRLPDVIVFPTGGGTGIVGLWKAFSEMKTWGWIGSSWPRLVLVQSAGCSPIVRAFESGATDTVAWPDPKAGPHGLRVPDPFGGSLCLRALRDTSGIAVAIPDSQLYEKAQWLSAVTGLDICPEGGGAWSAFERLRDEGWISPAETVAVFNTGAGSKYGRSA